MAPRDKIAYYISVDARIEAGDPKLAAVYCAATGGHHHPRNDRRDSGESVLQHVTSASRRLRAGIGVAGHGCIEPCVWQDGVSALPSSAQSLALGRDHCGGIRMVI